MINMRWPEWSILIITIGTWIGFVIIQNTSGHHVFFLDQVIDICIRLTVVWVSCVADDDWALKDTQLVFNSSLTCDLLLIIDGYYLFPVHRYKFVQFFASQNTFLNLAYVMALVASNPACMKKLQVVLWGLFNVSCEFNKAFSETDNTP